MNKLYIVAAFVFSTTVGVSQSYYFPPNTGNQWDTVSPASLNWCTDKLDTVYKFLETKNTKAFIVLKGGKIAAEKYFGSFTADSAWYWASAGKTITAFLVGVAQQEGDLDINDSTSRYLGTGWTSCPPDKERLITLKHQLTMTTGLDDMLAPTAQEPDPDNCLKPECLVYKADAGTRWAYHNAPYRLLQDIIDSATGFNINQYTTLKLKSVTGMNGLWMDYIYYSKPREMARFGSLILNRGKWGNTTIMNDTAYFNAMVNTSQSINPSYGYLWWLNGKGSYKLPSSQLTYNTDLAPNAPDDMIAALGKNDQKLYVIPSLDMVVVRMGNSAGSPLFALSEFDNQLWGLLSQVFCNNTSVNLVQNTGTKAWPNPVGNELFISGYTGSYAVHDITGRQVLSGNCFENTAINTSALLPGLYLLVTQQGVTRLIKN